MYRRSRIALLAAVVMVVASCGGNEEGGPETTRAGGGTGTTGGPGATDGPDPTQPTGGQSGDAGWVEVDGTRFEANSSQCNDSGDDSFQFTTSTPLASGQNHVVVVVSKYSVVLLGEETDLQISAQLGYSGPQASLRSEYGYAWVGRGSRPVRGAEVIIDRNRIKAGPFHVDEGGPVPTAVSFDLELPGDCSADWAVISASTPPGTTYARFDIGGEVIEFDEDHVFNCNVASGLRVSGPSSIPTVPSFNLNLAVDAAGNFTSPHTSVSVQPATNQTWRTELDSIYGSDFESVQLDGRRATGTALFRVAGVANMEDVVLVPGSFDVNCG